MVLKRKRIGIIGASEIAFRRFLPALVKCEKFEYAGIASRNKQKTDTFIKKFGGSEYYNYDEMLIDESVDAIYLPLPPALHYEWAKKALLSGKHVLVEKPFTSSICHTIELIEAAKGLNLALHENYMFLYHRQIEIIRQIIREGMLGDLRLIKASFGFPRRGSDDFRYNKELGGGSLLDCGGYTIKLANILLGDGMKAKAAKLNYLDEFNVDIFGSATFENEEGLVAQISFGMDNSYKCELEVWGSKGHLTAPRIFTAPPDFNVKLYLNINNQESTVEIGIDDQFLNSIEYFYNTIINEDERRCNYAAILQQSRLIESIIGGQ